MYSLGNRICYTDSTGETVGRTDNKDVYVCNISLLDILNEEICTTIVKDLAGKCIYSHSQTTGENNFKIVVIDNNDIQRSLFVAYLLYGFIENYCAEQLLQVLEVPLKSTYTSRLKKWLKPYHIMNTKQFLSNASGYSVDQFALAECAFQYRLLKKIDEKEYKSICKIKTVQTLQKYMSKCELNKEINTITGNGFELKFNILVDVLLTKAKQHQKMWKDTIEEIKLRPIYYKNEDVDLGAGTGEDYTGKNMLGEGWKIVYLNTLKEEIEIEMSRQGINKICL